MNRELTIDNDIEFNIMIQHLNRLIIAVRIVNTVKCFAHGQRTAPPGRVGCSLHPRAVAAVHSGEHKRALCKNILISAIAPECPRHTAHTKPVETSTHEARHAPANAALPLSPL